MCSTICIVHVSLVHVSITDGPRVVYIIAITRHTIRDTKSCHIIVIYNSIIYIVCVCIRKQPTAGNLFEIFLTRRLYIIFYANGRTEVISKSHQLTIRSLRGGHAPCKRQSYSLFEFWKYPYLFNKRTHDLRIIYANSIDLHSIRIHIIL